MDTALFAPPGAITLAPGDAGAALTTSLANVSGAVALLPGAYAASTAVLVPSSTNLTSSADVAITSSPGNSGDGHTNSPFVGVSTAVQVGTLTADVVEGSSSFTASSVAELTVGGHVALNLNGDVALIFKIAGIAGNVVTTDVPIPFAFPHASPAATAVIAVVPTTNVHVDFGGATLTQTTGARGFWFPYFLDGEISHLIALCSGSVFGPDLDIGGRRGVLRKIRALFAANVGDAGVAIEGGTSMLMEECSASGAFPSGIQLGGYRNEVRGCSSDGAINNGLVLCPQGPDDLWGSQRGLVSGGRYDGSAIGVFVTGNSSDNALVGVAASYNTSAGFAVYAGAIAVVGGPQRNTFTACVSRGGAYGWIIGDTTTGAADTTLAACSASGGSQAALLVNADAARTMVTGFRSSGNAIGIYAYADLVVTGFVSINDATPVRTFNSANVSITGARIEFNSSSGSTRAAVYADNTSTVTLTDVLIELNGTGGGAQEAVVVVGNAHLTNVRVVTAATGTYGIVGGGSSTITIGPGCDFGACATPFLPQGANVSMVQTGGVAAVSATGTLTFVQNYCTAIELAAAAAANTTITTLPIAGLRFTARNLTAAKTLTVITSTSGDTGVTIAAGKSAIVEVRASDLKMMRVTADT